MAVRLPPLRSLRAFEAAARYLSFTRAADELCVTQAAVSHQIKSLEDFLGMALFFRRNRKLMLTDEGQRYWPKVRDVFDLLRQATDDIQSQGAMGTLTVGVLPTFATVWLVPRLSKFKDLYPDIEVRLKASDDKVDFLREEIDVSISYNSLEISGIYSETFLSETLTPVCSPSLLKSNKRLKEPKDLKQHILLHDASTKDWQRWLKLAGVKGIDLNQGPIFSHTAMVQQAAIYGQGVCMGHSVLFRDDVRAGRLVQPFELAMQSELSYAISCPQESLNRLKIKVFIDWLLNIATSDI